MIVIWAFLSQVLDVDKSCHNAVSRIIAWLAAEETDTPSSNTSAYCQARKRLPEKVLTNLFSLGGNKLENKTKKEQKWCGRHVKVFDGSSVSMPDTLKNQQTYPQHNSQKPGCGFPIAKIGVLFSIATGAAMGIVIDVFNIHDVKLARRLYKYLNPGDVFLSDRACCSYADISFIKKRKCDAVIRLHQSRQNQIKKRKSIGSCDQLVTWNKPKSRPKGLSKEEFDHFGKH